MSPDELAAGRVYLTGHIDVPADRLTAVRDALDEHIALTRAEPGCLSFDVVEQDDPPGRFSVAEVFENQQAFDAHQERTKQSAWFQVTERIPRHYTITTKAD
ncbi:MAG: antibiotic biosynthesis monooxygenase [Alphaproteobacteria bacterium]|nr:antibiotic biosynthesis monooxygenase [Alphaproteobacteria bacterium SS10]